jgi:hypothetical protein
MRCYADLAPVLLRWKIIRRNVCTAMPISSAVGIELTSGIRSEQF